MALCDEDANAMLVLPKPSQEPLWVLRARDFIPVVWNGGSSFFIPRAESFVPSSSTFYFVLRASQSVRGVWYVWAPRQYLHRIRVNGLHIDPHLHIIRDADVISVRPPKFREENISISFFLPSPFLDEYTPRETLRCGVVSRTYACRPTRTQVGIHKNSAVMIVRATRFADMRSFDNCVQREHAIVEFLTRRGGHPHIIRFHDIYLSPASAYFVTERFDQYLDCMLSKLRKHGRRIAVCDVRDYARGICSAALFLNSLGIVLRNISIKTIYMCRNVPKLGDFTAASYLPLNARSVAVKELVNPIDYVYLAPEVLQEAHQDERVDCWSVGMVLKALLLGLPILSGFLEYEFRAANLSDSTIDVIGRLLRENPQNRCSMAAILGHPWFNEC